MAAEAKTTDSKKEESKAKGETKAEEKSDAKTNESSGDATAGTSTDAKKDESSATVEKEDKDGAATAKGGDEEPAATGAEEETTDAPAQQPTEQDHRNRRVYVGNLAWGVSWQDLKDHMKTTGYDVNRANIMQTPDGRSKGCGIVEFATVEGAQKAVETLNDTELNGRQIFVREDREDRGGNSGGQRSQYGQRGGGGGGGGGGSQQPSSSSGESKSLRVYVGNLSWDVAWQDLKDHMRQAGEVVHAEVISESNGRSKGCGIVEYSSVSEAQEAISTLTDTELKGRMIFVREDRETSGGGGGPGRGGGRYGGRGGGRGRGRGGRYRNYRPNQNYQSDQNQEGNGEAGAGGCQLFVGQLSYDTTWRELKDHFRQCGDVERAEVMSNMDGRSKGFGTVRFFNKKDADSAIERLNGVELQGRSLVVRIDNKAK